MVGITKSVQYALAGFGVQVEDHRTLTHFIGPPLIDAFMEYYRFTPEDARAATDRYRERFSTVGLYENEVYEGIPQLLDKLKQAGKKLLVATSKPEVFARQILEHLSLDGYFDFIGGSTMDETRTHKEEVIAYLLAENGITDLSQVVMIGDRKYDVAGAHSLGIRCVGVLYGFGDLAEMQEAGADAIAEDIDALEALLL